MGVASYFEFVTTLLGWVIYQGIWAVLVDTGIVFIPLITMVVGNIVSSHRAGDDEGSAAVQSLKKIEADFFMMVGVLIFAAIPALDVELSEMSYTKPPLRCDAVAETIDGTSTGTTYDRTLATISDQTGGIPIWWAGAHVLSKGVTAGAIASIPCAPDLSSVEYRLANDSIDDPGLRKELNEFTDDCYRKSKSRLLRSDTSTLTQAQIEDTHWLGSEYFLTTTGYYDRYYAQNPQSLFPFDAVRDAGFEGDALVGGHPSCTDWWSDASKGVRRKVLDSIDPDMLDEMVYDTGNLVSQSTDSALDTAEREDVFLRKYLATNRAREGLATDLPMSTGYMTSPFERRTFYNQDSGLIGRAAEVTQALVADASRVSLVAVGSAIKAPQAIGEGYMIRQGVSMFQSIALLIVVVVLPFLMLFGQYKTSTLFTLTIVFFSLHFLSFLWAMAYWLDNNLMHLMTEGGRFGVFEPIANPVQSGIILWMQRFLYMIMPAIFMAGMGWVGIGIGNFGGNLTSFASQASQPGSAGGSVVAAAATRGVGKG